MSLLARAADTSGRCQKESGKAMGPNALSRIGSPALVQIRRVIRSCACQVTFRGLPRW